VTRRARKWLRAGHNHDFVVVKTCPQHPVALTGNKASNYTFSTLPKAGIQVRVETEMASTQDYITNQTQTQAYQNKLRTSSFRNRQPSMIGLMKLSCVP
jgi:hypothetical protein